MKHDLKAIDEIQSLEEAKEIISMITGSPYLDGEVYQIESEKMTEKLKDYKNLDFDDISRV